MRIFISILLVLTVANRSPAADTNVPASSKTAASAVLKIGAAEADKYYDQVMIVTGTVAQVTIRPKVKFLNLDQPFPNSPFTVVIFPGTYLADVNALKGRAIEIKGRIKNYNDKPEIVLDNTNQLTVLGSPTPPFTPMTTAPTPAPVVSPSTNSSPPATESTNLPEIM